MSKNQEVIQLNLRVPAELKAALEKAADISGVSLNKEMNNRLLKSFESDDEKHNLVMAAIQKIQLDLTSGDRTVEVAKRLNEALVWHAKTTGELTLNPAKVAFQLGHETASLMVDWFNGKKEPPFSELEILSNYFGCNKDWLLFGISEPYSVQDLDMSLFKNDSAVFLDWLFSDDEGAQVTSIDFICKSNQQILIVKRFGCTKSVTYRVNAYLRLTEGKLTPSSAFLLKCLAGIKDKYIYHNVIINSYTDGGDAFGGSMAVILQNLEEGKVPAPYAIKKLQQSPWLLELWHEGNVNDAEYWDGFGDLVNWCRVIQH